MMVHVTDVAVMIIVLVLASTRRQFATSAERSAISNLHVDLVAKVTTRAKVTPRAKEKVKAKTVCPKAKGKEKAKVSGALRSIQSEKPKENTGVFPCLAMGLPAPSRRGRQASRCS